MKKNIFSLFTGISVVVLITVISCSKHNKNIASNITTPKSTTAHRYDTITSLDKMIGDTAIWILKGQYILVTHEKSTDEEYELEYEKTNSTSSSNCVETFGGSARSVDPRPLPFLKKASDGYRLGIRSHVNRWP